MFTRYQMPETDLMRIWWRCVLMANMIQQLTTWSICRGKKMMMVHVDCNWNHARRGSGSKHRLLLRPIKAAHQETDDILPLCLAPPRPLSSPVLLSRPLPPKAFLSCCCCHGTFGTCEHLVQVTHILQNHALPVSVFYHTQFCSIIAKTSLTTNSTIKLSLFFLWADFLFKKPYASCVYVQNFFRFHIIFWKFFKNVKSRFGTVNWLSAMDWDLWWNWHFTSLIPWVRVWAMYCS